jgi:tetratricopeptide (TPR) repeat protein
MTSRSAVSVLALLAALLTTGLSPAAFGDEVDDAQQLVKQGNLTQALDRVNAYLAARPKDARGRFLKGVILAEQNKAGEAIKVFTALTEDYPELPEPYNNLAVLYAGQQQYDKARQALEMAIQTHPSYATAHENLGDIYAKMASQAYDRALQLDKNNAAAQTKLSLIKEIFPINARVQRPSTKVEPARPAPAAAAPVKPAPTAAVAPASTAVAAAPAAPAAAAKPQAPAVEKPAEKPAEKVEKPRHDPTPAITQTIQAWAKAWSAKNVNEYLAFYSADFRPPKGTRAEWEKTRRERVAAPKHIEVAVSGLKVTVADDTHATASFRQHYKADTLNNATTKTLTLFKSGEKWLIQQERVGS